MTNPIWLPQPFDWCFIPAGVVTLEDPPDSYEVAAFDMATYPITNAQFQVFVDAGDGYADTGWWDYSRKAQQWRIGKSPAAITFPGDDLPRVSVSWYEALAFCRWLSARTGEVITLPTELQWQRAAQGDDNRLYPWGNEYDLNRFNTSETGIKVPTPVTKYPNGASPYGVMDMSGNISEWCLNGGVQPDEDDSASFAGGEARAMRGGSWGLNRFSALAAFRGVNHPGDQVDYMGFRVARHRLKTEG